MSKRNMKPFLKWVGGKSQLIDVILPIIPTKYNKYIEPFLGGGAVFFEIEPKSAIISDINSEIINAFNSIKNDKNKLLKTLSGYIDQHSKELYLQIRNEFNTSSEYNTVRAAHFIYLNKTGFNGLYRVNSKGEFNVPFGQKKTIKAGTLFGKTNIDKIANYLNEEDISIYNLSFEEIEDKIGKGDFVFVDPPYDSDDDKSFDSYTKVNFGKEGQRKLAEFLKRLDRKGVKWMLTNHNTELINELYNGFEKFLVPVNRFINSDASNRVNATYETIFINYDLTNDQRKEFDKQLFYKELQSTSYILKEYVSWQEINNKIRECSIEIHDLNYLVSTTHQEFDNKFEEIFDKRNDSFKILPLLVAKRVEKNEKFKYLDFNKNISEFNHMDKENTYKFIEESGLLENVFIGKTNIEDYLFGIEVGLTSNDKKNKSGEYMESKISRLLTQKNIAFEKNIMHSTILNRKLEEDKEFDFVFEHDGIKYCVECNFFNSSGSKINSETSRFIKLNDGVNENEDMKFIWVTDGDGLKKAKNSIYTALDKIEHMYNLKRFTEFIEQL